MELILKYLKNLEKKHKMGNASELTYRAVLENFISEYKKDLTVTNEPRRIACGAPDLLISKREVPLGYIETKDIGIDLLSIEKDSKKAKPKTANGKQLKRYLGSLGNLILTDYLEFFWYRNGERVLEIRIGQEADSGKIKPHKENFDDFIKLLDTFFTEKTKIIDSPSVLAKKMASMAQLIRDVIMGALGDKDKGGNLRDQLDGFKKVLIHDLTEKQFADMYAQTICYGLFAAKFHHSGKEPFTRRLAPETLPKTNPFLRNTFGHIAGFDLDERVAWLVDDLAEILNHADIEAIGRDFGKRTRREDPVVHFYETFLAAYDPKMREKRGVYYTPEPVVSFIVRSVDHILKKDFGLKDGLADSSKVPIYKNKKSKDGKIKKTKTGECHKVLILDPAVGTGTFLHGVIDHIYEHIVEKGDRGKWSGYVPKHLLPRLFGFELLVAPYAVAHMKLGLQLKELGYDFKKDERLGIYLTNTLEESFETQSLSVFDNFIAEEANKASKVKSEKPVMAIMGNPPYQGHSMNRSYRSIKVKKGEKYISNWDIDKYGKSIPVYTKAKSDINNSKQPTFIGKLIKDYFICENKWIQEKNSKYLNDDYVKFIRFAQWRIEQTGYGILAFITNSSYLDSPTFRGMRQSLLNTFDHIYILDLHGNVKRKEVAPDGSKDENVFDIKQGVSIGIYIKGGRAHTPKNQLEYYELKGLREVLNDKKKLTGGKYNWLLENNINSTKWDIALPSSPYYLFNLFKDNTKKEYFKNVSLLDVLKVRSNGFKTHRDDFSIAFEHLEIKKRVDELTKNKLSIEELKHKYQLIDTGSWKLENAIAFLQKENDINSNIKKCIYRPFDIRYCFYSKIIMDRPRTIELRHALFNNICIAIGRQGQVVGGGPWNLVYVGKYLADTNLYYRGGIQYFPLYLYPDPNKNDLFDSAEQSDAPGGRKPNLAPEFIEELSKKIKLKFIPDGKGDLTKTYGPEDIFNYMYAVFHSPAYRKRYSEFLKIDFPRLPLTSKKTLFKKLIALGSELVGLHLMENHGPSMVKYPIDGEHEVEKVRYTEPGQGSKFGRVWINADQYFENIPPEIWEFHIGGYQVCHKWLKDRKGRNLSYDDIEHYQHIVSALSETIRLMAEIDKAIDKHGGWPIV